jgi:hypothetical protein
MAPVTSVGRIKTAGNQDFPVAACVLQNGHRPKKCLPPEARATPTFREIRYPCYEGRYDHPASMTLLDAKPFDVAKARRRKIQIFVGIALVLIGLGLVWFYRNWPEERVVSRFFDAIEHQQYELAYGIYFHDPTWEQHQQKYSQYTYADFYRDWGPGGEWGLVKSFRIYGSANTKTFGGGGVVVEVVVNERSEHARMFVQRSDKTLTVYPF